MIRLINLTKTYRGLPAVDRVNLEVGEGKVFGFLGPSGAGKTTTIKMMAGILQPTEGKVIINGMDLALDPVGVKRRVGFIPDRPFVYDKLAGVEFLEFVAGLYGLASDASLKHRIGELLDLFELEHWKDELIDSYSHGMKQRLVMCAALLHRPKVLIVDEPMVGLDPKAARLVKDIFREEAARNTTVFMSTHSLEIAEEVCDDIGIIVGGRVIARGTSEDLRRQAGVDGGLENAFLALTEGRGVRVVSELLMLSKPRFMGFRNDFRRRGEGRGRRVLILGVLALAFCLGAFALSSRVLIHFQSANGIGDLVARHLLGMILLTFFPLLIFSHIITALSNLYLSNDLELCHSFPVRLESIFLSRAAYSFIDSSWMLILFGLPVFMA